MAVTPSRTGYRRSPEWTTNARSGWMSSQAMWKPRVRRGGLPYWIPMVHGRGLPGMSNTRSTSALWAVR